MSVKLDVDGIIYQNVPLKDVTKVYILKIIYSEALKRENVVTIS